MDDIYAHTDEDLNNDETYSAAMLRVLRARYCDSLTGEEAPHPALVLWLMEGQHTAALHLLLAHGLIDVDLITVVHELLSQDAVLESS